MKTALIISLLVFSLPALADQQCQVYGNQMVCRDMPSYRDAQINSSIPLRGSAGSPNFGNLFLQAQQMRQMQLQQQMMEQQLRMQQQYNR